MASAFARCCHIWNKQGLRAWALGLLSGGEGQIGAWFSGGE